MADPNSCARKIGLVLTGGGAKGAYQIGCLKELRKAGYTRVKAIAGTSVGAMNATLLAAGKLETAEEAWVGLRWRDIIGFKPYKLLLLPVWIVAAVVSEFSLAKVLGISGSLLLPKRRVLLGMIAPTYAEELPPWAWFTLSLLGLIALVDDWSRRVFLGWIFTTNEPLARRLKSLLTEDDLERIRRSDIPVYATLSRHQPHVGWVPQYVRLDKLTRAGVVDTLLQSAGFPGIFPARKFWGRHAVDGGWTDNVPVAPLLFGPEARADMLFVIKVDKTARPRRWKKFLTRFFDKLWGEAALRTQGNPAELIDWAKTKWDLHTEHDPTQADPQLESPETRANSADPGVAPQRLEGFPRIITVVPSQSVGRVFTGTFWFSRAKARKLIELGEKDMAAVLAGLESKASAV